MDFPFRHSNIDILQFYDCPAFRYFIPTRCNQFKAIPAHADLSGQEFLTAGKRAQSAGLCHNFTAIEDGAAITSKAISIELSVKQQTLLLRQLKRGHYENLIEVFNDALRLMNDAWRGVP